MSRSPDIITVVTPAAPDRRASRTDSAAPPSGDSAPGPGDGTAQVADAATSASARLDAAPGQAAPATHGDDSAQAVPWSLRATASWCARLLVVGTTLYFIGKIYGRLHLVLFSFLIGLPIAAVLHPLFTLLRRAHFPRAMAALASVLVGVAALGAIGYFVATQISANTDELSTQLQHSVTSTEHWLTTGPLHLSQDQLDSVSGRITTAIRNNASAIATSALGVVGTITETLSGVLLVVLTAFFLVKDGDQIWRWTLSMLPHRARPKVDLAGRRSWHTLGGYVRGQVIIAVFHAVTITVALFILQVPLAVPLGVVVFVFSFIPLFGMIIAGSLAALIALLERGAVTALVVIVIVVLLVQLESHVLQPLIMSRAVEIHPLAVALAVVAGTKLDGISGALLAVPLVAIANTAMRSLHGQVNPDDNPGPRPDRPVIIRRPKRRRGTAA